MEMKLEKAKKIAQSLIEDLKSSCHRIEIGGSIRRNKPEVKDIELICIPVFDQFPTGQMSLEGDPITSFENLLFEHIAANRDKYGIIKMGEKYAQIEVIAFDKYIKVDVFTATFRTWGYIFMIRTGPADFSTWVVTELKKNGFRPEGGEVSHHGTPCTIPTEDDLFFLLGMDYIAPEDRRAR
jgi:DNA polymerase/3'-5' exonuclease PolX